MKCAKCGATLFKADIVRGNCFTCGCTIISKEEYEKALVNKKIRDEDYKKYLIVGNFLIFIGLGEVRMFKKKEDAAFFLGVELPTLTWRVNNVRPIGGYRVFNQNTIVNALDWEQELAKDMLNEIESNNLYELERELDLDYVLYPKYYDGFDFINRAKFNGRKNNGGLKSRNFKSKGKDYE